MDRKLRKKEFYSLCRQQIIPRLEKFEPYRKKQLTKLIISNTLFLLFSLPCLLYIFYSLLTWYRTFSDIVETLPYIPYILALFLISPVFIFLSLKINKDFLEYLKQGVTREIWTLFPDLQYKRNSLKVISIKDILQSSMFEQFWNKKTDDTFICSYKNIDAKMEETQLFIPNQKKGLDYMVFKGVILHFPLKKRVNGKTIVIKKIKNPFFKINRNCILFLFYGGGIALLVYTSFFSSFSFSFFELFVILLPVLIVLLSSLEKHILSMKKELSHVKLEDVEFMRDFRVLTDNQLESRFLLTPAFIQRLKTMQTAFGNKRIRCSFFDNSLMVAIENDEDLFEVGNIFIPLNRFGSLLKFYNQLSAVYEMIDYLHIEE